MSETEDKSKSEMIQELRERLSVLIEQLDRVDPLKVDELRFYWPSAVAPAFAATIHAVGELSRRIKLAIEGSDPSTWRIEDEIKGCGE